MKLNHLNLTVDDVPAARAFLEKHFGLRPVFERGKNFAGMIDDDDMVLTLMGAGSKPVSYPGIFHVGFIQPSTERVDEINQALRDDGYDVEPPSRQHGSWTFYFRAPGGVTIEVLHDHRRES